MRKTVFFTYLFLQTCLLIGQTAPQYSLYMLNPVQFNPAFAGLERSVSCTGVFRRQWTGLPGSPSQQHANVHLPLYLLNSGVGLSLDNDMLGARQYLSASLAYSYHLQVGIRTMVAFGIGAGVSQLSWDGSELRTPDGDYTLGAVNHQDQLLPGTKQSAIAPQMRAGISLKTETLEAGVSVHDPVSWAYQFEGVDIESRPTIYLFGKYKWPFFRALELQPSLLLKSDLSSWQAEGTLAAYFNSKILGGATFRGFTRNTLDAVVLFAGVRLAESTMLCYSYDLSLSGLRDVNQGSHEVVIQYVFPKPFGKGKLPKIIYNPRYL
jgi:type IX secretion system PorP/SprF family membrane protein